METLSINETGLKQHLVKLAEEIGERPPGSRGNAEAVAYAADALTAVGWNVQLDLFQCMDWEPGSVRLEVQGQAYEAFASPYSLGCQVTGELVAADTVEGLQAAQVAGKVLLITGQLASEQLMPKNFVFYNPEEHRQLIALLEEKSPLAILCATGPGTGLSKGLDPFPVFEDGDFHIPSVYMKETHARPLLQCQGQQVTLISESRRIPATGHNLVARKKGREPGRIILCAHIDTKKNTPGALDNATGVAVLLALAEALQPVIPSHDLELVLFNGEDYYAVSGQMLYLSQNPEGFQDVKLVVNIDGAGFRGSCTGLSFYNLTETRVEGMLQEAGDYPSLVKGQEWYEGDHSIFLQQGVPTMAATSSNMHEEVMLISHTPQDTLDKVDTKLLTDLASYLAQVVARVN